MNCNGKTNKPFPLKCAIFHPNKFRLNFLCRWISGLMPAAIGRLFAHLTVALHSWRMHLYRISH